MGPSPRCVDGRRAGPPEDCGGLGGLQRLLQRRPRRDDDDHDDHDDHDDPAAFSIDAVTARLGRAFTATIERWVMVSIAVILGAATHLLWDGFTHAWLWPASALYPDSTIALFGEPVLISRVLQHTSSVIGLAIVLAYLYRTAPPASDLDGLARRHATRRLLTILPVPIVGGVIAAGIKFQAHDPLITRLLWNAAWSAAAWFALLLGAVCLVERLRGRDS